MSAALASAVYEGIVRHRRFGPVPHAFSYRIFLMYLDLAEIDRVFAGRWLWSAARPALARFRREDHLGDPSVPLDQAVRDLVETRTGVRPDGPIRLLTQVRHLGVVFNPVSFYYCFDVAGREVTRVVAEVHNTPWGERHVYVIEGTAGRTPKAMHVSPFLGMDLEHDFRFTTPGPRLGVRIEDLRDGRRVLSASLALRRRAISGPLLTGLLVRFPWTSLRTLLAIYAQALRLWLRGAPVHAHPAPRRGVAP